MPALSRRAFLSGAASCASHLALAAAVMPAGARRAWAQPASTVVAREAFGRLEQVADGVWALVSTPLDGARTTLCNGGLVRGRTAVLAIEAFNDPAGAAWLAARSLELTGRWPTLVALTHYHADHTNGVAGYFDAAHDAVVRCTDATRQLVVTRNRPADEARARRLESAVLLGPEPATIDLGGRAVRVLPLDGHTDSDVAIEIEDPRVMFCGDLVWNGMFPNYVDASPTRLWRSVERLRRAKGTVYVPGHGPVSGERELDTYAAVLQAVEAAARDAHAKGLPAADAAASLTLPAALGEWTLFNKAFYERAIAAWYRDLGR